MAKTKIKKEVKKDVKKAVHKAVKTVAKKKVSLRQRARTGQVSVKGRGGYWADLGRSVGGGIGGLADGVIGLGKAITGVGDYSIKSNSLMETAGPPRIRNTKHQSIVHHEEYLCDIKGSQNFTIQQFPLNPGVTTTFPWLASQALSYEQWRPRGIIFSFRSSCGDAISSTDNAEGMIIMATEYNSNLPPFADKQEMEEHEYVTSFKPSCNGLHGIECARHLTPLDQLYVRGGSTNGSNSANYNPLSYDLGQFYVATQGMQTDGITVGELWVSYELELLKPTLSTVNTTNIYQHWYWDSTLGPAPVPTAPFRNLRNVNTGQTTGSATIALPGFQAGRYIISIFASGAVVSFPAGTNVSLIGGTVINFTDYSNVINANQGSTFAPVSGSTAASVAYGLDFTSPGSFSFVNSSVVTLTTIASFDVHITPIGNGLNAPSRRAIDWDPFAKISRRIDQLAALLGQETFNGDSIRARYRDGATMYNRISHPDWDECKSPGETDPPNSPVLVRSPEIPDLSRSQVDFATSLLSRLSARGLTSKTGSTQAA